MSPLQLAAYRWDPGALLFLIAGALAFGAGGAVLLYERFTPASRRSFVLSAFVLAWLGSFALAALASGAALTAWWIRLGMAAESLVAPALYALSLFLAGDLLPWRLRAAWGAGAAFALLSLAGADPLAGLRRIAEGSAGPATVVVVAAFLLFHVLLLGAAVAAFARAARRAPTPFERHRHAVLLLATGAAALGLGDVFLYALGEDILLSPASVLVSTGLFGIAALRYRAFALTSSFAADRILDAMAEAVLVCDLAPRVRIANPSAERLLGYEGALEGLGLDALFPGDGEGGDVPSPGERFRDRRGRMLRRDGEVVDVSFTSEPLHGPRGLVGTVLVARDIRGRLQRERALAASEQRYRSLFSHNPGPVVEVSPDGRLRHVNPAFARLFGQPAGELANLHFQEVVAPEDREMARSSFMSALQATPLFTELALLTPRGERVEVQGAGVPVVIDGRVEGIFGVMIDITEENRAKRELEVQRRLFTEIFQRSPEALVIVSLDGTVREANDEFVRMFGYGRDEAVGRSIEELIIPEKLRDEARLLRRSAAAGSVTRIESIRHRKDGSPVEVAFLGRELNVPGQPPQLLGIYHDVGDRKRAERALREREEELRQAQALEAVGKLAGGIAHDFNNLMTVIHGNARGLLDRLATGHELRPELEEIEAAGARAASLTAQLLAYSRRQVLRPQSLDLDAVVRKMEKRLAPLMGDHIRWVTSLAAAPARVRVDRRQLEQVLLNLVMNARDSMVGGGTLSIRTDRFLLAADAPEVSVWQMSPGPCVRLVVEDTGPGMGPDVLARLFEPYFTTKAQGKGSGLGLSTVFGIVKQSGGHVVAESEESAGARLSVYLPEVFDPPGPEGAEASPESEATDPPAGRTILLVEDEASVRRLAERVLVREGFQVLTAAHGTEALEVAGGFQGTIDLVVTDVVMPEMGGRTLARRIRSERPGVRIIFMSGYDEELVLGGGDARAEAFLPKPFTPDRLLEIVREHLDPT